MDIRNLRHFVTVADTLNFRIAGERLHLSQPALTRSIASLERDLGVSLFFRDTRGVALSTEGAQLLERARRILASTDEFSYAAHSLRAETAHELRVGVFGNGLAELTYPVLSRFTDEHPEVSVLIREADFARGIDPLLDGEFDVAFVRVPAELPVLHARHIFSEPLDVVLWEGHALAGTESVDVADILTEQWVTFPPSIPAEWASFWLFASLRKESVPSVGFYARSEGEFAAAVAYRHLVGVLPASAMRLRPHRGVVTVPAHSPDRSVAAVAYPSSGYSPSAVALAEVAEQVAAERIGDVFGATLASSVACQSP